MPKSLRHDGVIPRLWTVVLVVATVCFSNACRKKGQAPAEEAWHVAERETETMADDAGETRDSDDEPELPVPPPRDRPPPDWEASANATVHTHEERVHRQPNPCLEVNRDAREVGSVKISPFSSELSLDSLEDQHEIHPYHYRVRIRFPDFSDEWHEFEVESDGAFCRAIDVGLNVGDLWHVTWGGVPAVVYANLPLGEVLIHFYQAGCKSPPPPERWYWDLLFAEVMFLNADGARTVSHAVYAEPIERAQPIEPGVRGRVGDIVFYAPAFGTDYCLPPPQKGLRE